MRKRMVNVILALTMFLIMTFINPFFHEVFSQEVDSDFERVEGEANEDGATNLEEGMEEAEIEAPLTKEKKDNSEEKKAQYSIEEETKDNVIQEEIQEPNEEQTQSLLEKSVNMNGKMDYGIDHSSVDMSYEINSRTIQPYRASGLLGATILNRTNLIADYSNSNQNIITLSYSGRGLLNLIGLDKTYIIFSLPSEIMATIGDEKDRISISYDVPTLAVGGIVLIRNKGTFDKDKIKLDNNQISVMFKDLLSIAVLTDYNFTLTVKLDILPLTTTNTYHFYAEATDELINVRILSENQGIEGATLPAPPQQPEIKEPIYYFDEFVKGTGQPNTCVEISNGVTKTSESVDSEGNFNVKIDPQDPGTELTVTLINHEGMRSPPVSIIVQDGTIAFFSVPEIIQFKPTIITSGVQYIPVESLDKALTIHDTRISGSQFRIEAKAEPLSHENSNHIISNAVFYKDKEGDAQDLTSTTSIYSGNSDEMEDIKEIPLKDELFLKVDPLQAFEGTYNTKITWTIVTAP